MNCVSVTYRTAPLWVREKAAFHREQLAAFYHAARESGISGCVLLSTCNRTELFFCGKTQEDCRTAENLLARECGTPLAELLPYFRIYQGEGAARHLFRVASGIDSMLMGEDEILGQVKEAFAYAADCGMTGYELNTVFRAAVTWAKKIKTETMLSKTSVSIATLAANEVFRLPGTEKNVLIIGASGKMGMTVMKNLACRETVRIFGTFRSHNALLTQAAGKADATLIPYEERYACMDKMDAVISATSSPHYTVTKKQLEPALRREKERLFLDISVPPDIDREIQTLPGVHLRNIDAFRELAKTNNDLKQQEAVQAERMIQQGLDEWKRDVLLHGFLPELPAVKAKMAEIPFEKLVYRAKADMDAGQFEALLAVLRGMEEER
ncbi:MAG: glutamyl-tRNA reductase [Anaerotignum sp.]|nr:glutamyl-tRNA reductase [Anaerotignum sp.]